MKSGRQLTPLRVGVALALVALVAGLALLWRTSEPSAPASAEAVPAPPRSHAAAPFAAPAPFSVAPLATAAVTAPTTPLDAFDAWLGADRHASGAVSRGIELARARREALRDLIRTDPEAALARAVPYALRRELPAPIVALLETPVSTTADLDVALACGGPEGRSLRELRLTLAGRSVEVFAYGQRADLHTKQRLSVHGIALDDIMAMRDDPVRELSPEEVADRGFAGRVVQFGKRFLAVESDAALATAREKLRATEESLGPEALPAYRDFALGRMPGIYPLAMQDGSSAATDDDLPPVAYSPWTEGAKTMLYIRARFADELPTYEPVSLATAQTRQAENEAFWRENSYGKSSLTTTYTTVVTLPKPGGDYVNNFGALIADARAAAVAANPAWAHTNFNFQTVITNFATNAQGAGFSYSGIAQLGGPFSHVLRNDIGVRNASHEYGHNLGLQHSGYWLTDSPSPIGPDSAPGGYSPDAPDDEVNEYGHKFAVMGSQPGAGDFDGGRAHFTAADKNLIDWLATSAGDIATTSTGGTFRLYRHDVRSADFGAMTTGVARALKIDRPATDPTGLTPAYKYWLNFRMLPTNGIAGSWLPHGLQVDWRRDGRGFRAIQLDMTPFSRDSGPYGNPSGPLGDNNDKEDAVLLVGRTFSDTGADIHFTPTARGGTNPNEWLDVVVHIGTQAANTAPQIQTFTVGNSTPAVGETVNFAVSATDANGDTLAYHWDMGDNTVQSSQLNRTTRAKAWSTPGFYLVRAEVSDMKGGKATATALIQVGTPANTGRIQGRITHAGRPVEGVLVRGGEASAWTGADGTYVLPGLAPGAVTVAALKDGLTFARQFTNPVQLTALNTFGIDFAATEPWTGGGGNVALVSPHHLELPVGHAAQFTAQAFTTTGAPTAFNPTWTVSGGGVINANGVFTAQSLGGPFTLTAQDGPLTATATVTVIAAPPGPASNGTWTNASGGSWPATGNWSGGTVAGGGGFTADFSTLNPTADATLNLDGPRTIGSLVFGDTATGTAAGWTLAAGTNGSLTLAGASPTLTVNALGSGKFASITAPLGGLNGFTKTGPGNLLLNNSSNSLRGPIILNSGNLQLNSASLASATSVTLNGGALIVATSAANALSGTLSFAGGVLQFNQNPGTDYSAQFSTAPNQQYRINVAGSREATFAAALSSTGGTLTKSNVGTLTLAAANSYTGGTTLASGTLVFAHPAALGSGPLAFTGTATLQAGGTHALPNALSVASGLTGTINTNGHNPTLGGALTGAGTLIKTGAGTLNLSGGAANTFSGTILVNEGTLANDNISAPSGLQSFANIASPVTVAAGATFHFTQYFTPDALDNALTLSGAGTGGLGALNLSRNATASGPITLAADATISKNFNNATVTGPITGADRTLTLATLASAQPALTVTGPIQLGTGGVVIVGAGGTAIVTLSGELAYTGQTRVQTGTLRLTGDARIQDSATVRIDAGANLQLDFTGTDTVAALVLGGTAMPDGTYGSLSSTADNRSASFLGNGILRVGAAPPENYASWAASQSPPIVSGPDGDADQDGIPNLIEYALAAGAERGIFDGATITFTKRGAPYGTDLTYVLEVSTTLAPDSWTPVVTHGPAQLASPVSYTLATTPGTPRIFARLRVVQTP